ncbi:MAG TPA: nuclear transport factor 2 family protein [Sphingobium sp.]|uniref:nuclear transport factor 2 family protein n=1 Tax=Sphingobium sp. TaxID=1912891 RepID=UPI002ED1B080
MNDFVVAECGIRQLHARFVDAVWRKDDAAFGACWGKDAEWKIATLHMHGRDEIQGIFAKLLGACQRVQLIPGPLLLEVTGDTAIGRVNCTELAKMGDGSSAMTLGVYHDHYTQEDGRWVFARRHFGLHYRGPLDFSGEIVAESPDFGPFPNMPAPDAPTYTRRAQS